MQCHYIYILKKLKNLKWKYYQMIRDIPFFCVLLQILFNYSKKAKFIVGENKYVCGYCKIIQTLNPKCNRTIP